MELQNVNESQTGLNINKTLKVTGVSKLLRDQLIKEFQRKGNSTGFHNDVNKLYVCQQGNDYALVEFVNDLPSGNFNNCIVHYSTEYSPSKASTLE